MARLKQHMHQHLHSAKEWLTKAEDAFDKQHDIRAELDLMLAQAELQHVKETNRSRQGSYKYALFRHGLALTLATFMAVTVGGVYWWTTRPVLTVPMPLSGVPVSLPVEVAPKVQETVIPSTPPLATRAEEHSQPVEQVAKEKELPRSGEVQQVSQPKQSSSQEPVILSNNEVQKLVRAAGKTLRGQ